jgi:hypothetical protein
MLQTLPNRTLLVLPVGVLSREEVTYRADAAADLAEALRRAGFPGARAGDRTYALPFPRQPNQAWIFWKRFRALADSVRESPPDGDVDYVLLMDVLGGVYDDGSIRGIGGIHVMVITGNGALTYGVLRNSYHESFRRIEPRTLIDACRLAVEDILAARDSLSPSPLP